MAMGSLVVKSHREARKPWANDQQGEMKALLQKVEDRQMAQLLSCELNEVEKRVMSP